MVRINLEIFLILLGGWLLYWYFAVVVAIFVLLK